MKKFTLLATATACFIGQSTISMEKSSNVGMSMRSTIISSEGLDDILTPEVIVNAIRLNDVKPVEVVIFYSSTEERDQMPNRPGILLDALKISSRESLTELKVAVDWGILKQLALKPETIQSPAPAKAILKPTIIQRLVDPVTLATAAATGVLVYYFAKNKGE